MIRTLLLTTLALISLATVPGQAHAGFSLPDVGQMLRARGYNAQLHPDGYYLIQQGGYPFRVFPSADGAQLIFRVDLIGLETRHFDSPQFRRVLRLHETAGFLGNFDFRDNRFFFNLRVDFDDFRPFHLDDHFRHISRTLDRHREEWHPSYWYDRGERHPDHRHGR
jgi:hypothetical protein